MWVSGEPICRRSAGFRDGFILIVVIGDLVSQLVRFMFFMALGFNVAHAQPDGAPRVIDVVISGSNSVHTPYSLNLADGSGSQIRTVPVGGADTLSILFNEDVNIQSDFLTFVGMRTAARPAVTDYHYDIAERASVWQFAQPLVSDLYAVRLRQSVTDVDGNFLDGDWTNPRATSTTSVAVSEFPSGDGNAGGDFVFVLNILAGDTNRDNRVNNSDARPNPPYSTWEDGDANGDGVVNQLDQDIRDAHAGMSATTLSLLADLNRDWTVDYSDLDILARNQYMPYPTKADGDLDGNGQINLPDAALFYAQQGVTIRFVPEPSSCLASCMAAILLAGSQFRHPRQTAKIR
jgi:hypothetical protein